MNMTPATFIIILCMVTMLFLGELWSYMAGSRKIGYCAALVAVFFIVLVSWFTSKIYL